MLFRSASTPASFATARRAVAAWSSLGEGAGALARGQAPMLDGLHTAAAHRLFGTPSWPNQPKVRASSRTGVPQARTSPLATSAGAQSAAHSTAAPPRRTAWPYGVVGTKDVHHDLARPQAKQVRPTGGACYSTHRRAAGAPQGAGLRLRPRVSAYVRVMGIPTVSSGSIWMVVWLIPNSSRSRSCRMRRNSGPRSG